MLDTHTRTHTQLHLAAIRVPYHQRGDTYAVQTDGTWIDRDDGIDYSETPIRPYVPSAGLHKFLSDGQIHVLRLNQFVEFGAHYTERCVDDDVAANIDLTLARDGDVEVRACSFFPIDGTMRLICAHTARPDLGWVTIDERHGSEWLKRRVLLKAQPSGTLRLVLLAKSLWPPSMRTLIAWNTEIDHGA